MIEIITGYPIGAGLKCIMITQKDQKKIGQGFFGIPQHGDDEVHSHSSDEEEEEEKKEGDFIPEQN